MNSSPFGFIAEFIPELIKRAKNFSAVVRVLLDTFVLELARVHEDVL